MSVLLIVGCVVGMLLLIGLAAGLILILLAGRGDAVSTAREGWIRGSREEEEEEDVQQSKRNS